eukprot:SAG25_NODE_145_length_13941_cov_48.705967_12_plen_65_part_00
MDWPLYGLAASACAAMHNERPCSSKLFMNEWRLDDSLNEMHDLFLTTCVKELYDTLTWCIKTRF